MIKNHDTHSWLGCFAGRLFQLRPELGIGSAVACAVHSIHHAADIDPQRAAEIFVLSNPGQRRPRITVRTVEAPSLTYRALFGAPRPARPEVRVGA